MITTKLIKDWTHSHLQIPSKWVAEMTQLIRVKWYVGLYKYNAFFKTWKFGLGVLSAVCGAWRCTLVVKWKFTAQLYNSFGEERCAIFLMPSADHQNQIIRMESTSSRRSSSKCRKRIGERSLEVILRPTLLCIRYILSTWLLYPVAPVFISYTSYMYLLDMYSHGSSLVLTPV